MAKLNNVTVLGTGVLGAQIAFQAAYAGFTVVAYDINEAALDKAKATFQGLVETYKEQVEGAADGKADAAYARVSYSCVLAESVKDADLVIEAVPEKLALKQSIFAEIGAAAPAKTIFATNTSTLLPSDIKDSSGRPDRFLALHFANMLWVNKTAEVMVTPDTSPEVFATVVEYATDMGMVPIEIKKEKAGYLLNSLLVPWLDAASELYVDGYADPETVDKAWRVSTGAPMGPFQIIDMVGLNTVYEIAATNPASAQQKWAKLLKEQYIDQGKLGLSTGEGIYKYPAK
ncbi:3-hydroxyacyl-CoA dehydrogenase [Tomitella biformata]|uniref:3-hydroxyacyl-CoA dehydrogenase n=1 Tax=Tomitella biformata TaxID=630403 RepID=UPI000465BC36|nr:3-hydroxyacyl-CoA dehydrogenase [Tomitella biformata]